MDSVQAEIDKLTSYIKDRFPKNIPFQPGISPKGDVYIQLISTESSAIPYPDPYTCSLYSSLEDASSGARSAFDKYAENKSGVLYWRDEPEFKAHPDTGQWRFYMRLTILDEDGKSS